MDDPEDYSVEELCDLIEEKGELVLDGGRVLIDCPASDERSVCGIYSVPSVDEDEVEKVCTGPIVTCTDLVQSKAPLSGCEFNPENLDKPEGEGNNWL